MTPNEKKGFHPLRVEEYPKIQSNCLAFALGQTKEVSHMDTYYNLDFDHYNTADAFINKCQEFGIKAKKIRLEEAHEDEYIICLFVKWASYKNPFYSEPIPYREFHVIRRELNGTWVHKNGWGEDPEVITEEEMSSIKEEYKEEPSVFALKVGE